MTAHFQNPIHGPSERYIGKRRRSIAVGNIGDVHHPLRDRNHGVADQIGAARVEFMGNESTKEQITIREVDVEQLHARLPGRPIVGGERDHCQPGIRQDFQRLVIPHGFAE